MFEHICFAELKESLGVSGFEKDGFDGEHLPDWEIVLVLDVVALQTNIVLDELERSLQ